MTRRSLCFVMVLGSAVALLLSCGSTNNIDRNIDGGVTLDRNAVFVANRGDSTVSAFQAIDPSGAGPVSGSPFLVGGPPTALVGGDAGEFQGGLLVLSEPQRSVAAYDVDLKTSVLKGPTDAVTTPFTPTAISGWKSFFYLANAEGSVSGFKAGASLAEVPGSPFPAGPGPAAILAHSGFLYVANSQSNDVWGYRIDPTSGALTPLAGSPFPSGQNPVSFAWWTPLSSSQQGASGFVFVANSGSNNVSVYSQASDGSLSPVAGSPFAAGDGPSSVAAGGTSSFNFVYVANSKSNSISGYTVDAKNGSLAPLTSSPVAAGTLPTSMSFSIDRWLYVANLGSNDLSVFQTDWNTGLLTPIAGSPFAVGKQPSAVLFFQVPQ